MVQQILISIIMRIKLPLRHKTSLSEISTEHGMLIS